MLNTEEVEENDFDDEPYCENEDSYDDLVLISVPLEQQDNSHPRSVSSNSTSLEFGQEKRKKQRETNRI